MCLIVALTLGFISACEALAWDTVREELIKIEDRWDSYRDELGAQREATSGTSSNHSISKLCVSSLVNLSIRLGRVQPTKIER